jgi:hypothetical protein
MQFAASSPQQPSVKAAAREYKASLAPAASPGRDDLEEFEKNEILSQVCSDAEQIMRIADKHNLNGQLTINEIRTFLTGPTVPSLYKNFGDWITEYGAPQLRGVSLFCHHAKAPRHNWSAPAHRRRPRAAIQLRRRYRWDGRGHSVDGRAAKMPSSVLSRDWSVR